MKFRNVVLIASLALAACQSEISDKPAAAVGEAVSTAAQGQPAEGAVTANVIKEQSAIRFVGAKVTGDHKGQFTNFDGTIDYVQGQPQRVAFTIDLNSVETDTEKLTGHLKSPDFFDVTKYPRATFASTSVAPAPAGSSATHLLRGTLDLHGVTKEVTIPVTAQVTAAGARTTSEFTINRHDWGISYRGMADDLIKDNVLIRLDLAFPPPPSA